MLDLDPIDMDRIFLGKDKVKSLVRDYITFACRGEFNEACRSLGIKKTTLRNYFRGTKQSIPTDVFYSMIESLDLEPYEFELERVELRDFAKKRTKKWMDENHEKVVANVRRISPLGIIANEKKSGKTRYEIFRELTEIMKTIHGDNYQSVIEGLRHQSLNYQDFDKEDLAPLFAFISNSGGYESIKIVGMLLQNESLSTEEISKRVKIPLNKVRSVMYKLSLNSVVKWKSPKTRDYKNYSNNEIYCVDKEQLRQKAKVIKRKNDERLISLLKENSNIHVACDCGFKTSFEDAFDVGFHCPNCNSVLKEIETPKVIESIRKRVNHTVNASQ